MTDWRDKTTMERAATEEFETALGTIIVTEKRVHVEFEESEDWKRIQREAGDDVILREVYWDEVADIDATTEHLYYRHIDVTVVEEGEEVEKRLYFLEDEEDVLEECLAAMKRLRNAYMQRHAAPGGTYSYAAVDATDGEEVELEDPDAQIRVEESEDASHEPAPGPAASGEAEDEEQTPDQAAVEEAKKLVQTARNKLHGKKKQMDQAGDTEDHAAEEDRETGSGADEEREADDDTGDEDEEDDVEDIVDDFLRD